MIVSSRRWLVCSHCGIYYAGWLDTLQGWYRRAGSRCDDAIGKPRCPGRLVPQVRQRST